MAINPKTLINIDLLYQKNIKQGKGVMLLHIHFLNRSLQPCS